MTHPQTLIVSLEPEIVRRTRKYVGEHSNYETLSEFVAVAIENQLALEGALPTTRGVPRSSHESGVDEARPPVPSDATLALLKKPTRSRRSAAVDPTADRALPSFTNRLLPVKVAARVLSNVDEQETLARFQRLAAQAARELGLRVRQEDEEAGRRGWSRRWVALPVGQDPEAALNRFTHHFTLVLASDGRLHGPLAALGLAAIDDSEKVAPTDLGNDLALMANPVLDGIGGEHAVLSDAEQELFVSAIRQSPVELAAVREFLGLAESHRGKQADVDASLAAARREGWSKAQAVAHRAAMVGRLRDLAMVEVEGRGPAARIRVGPQAEQFLEGVTHGA